jgi:predicted RNase H-like HicB family nuclease
VPTIWCVNRIPADVIAQRQLAPDAMQFGKDGKADRSEVDMKLEYPYTLEPQPEGGFLVQFIDFDEAFTEADTADEAAFNAVEVLSLVLEQRMEDAVEIPKPTPARGQPVARPQASVQAAIQMRAARTTRHVTG